MAEHRRRYSILFTLGLLLVIVVTLWGAFALVRSGIEKAREYRAARERLQSLRHEKEAFEAELRALERPETIERIAKERLNLKRAGEIVVVVPQVPTSSEAAISLSWWERIRRWFLK